jgi:hypothetical protein
LREGAIDGVLHTRVEELSDVRLLAVELAGERLLLEA